MILGYRNFQKNPGPLSGSGWLTLHIIPKYSFRKIVLIANIGFTDLYIFYSFYNKSPNTICCKRWSCGVSCEKGNKSRKTIGNSTQHLGVHDWYTSGDGEHPSVLQSSFQVADCSPFKCHGRHWRYSPVVPIFCRICGIMGWPPSVAHSTSCAQPFSRPTAAKQIREKKHQETVPNGLGISEIALENWAMSPTEARKSTQLWNATPGIMLMFQYICFPPKRSSQKIESILYII